MPTAVRRNSNPKNASVLKDFEMGRFHVDENDGRDGRYAWHENMIKAAEEVFGRRTVRMLLRPRGDSISLQKTAIDDEQMKFIMKLPRAPEDVLMYHSRVLVKLWLGDPETCQRFQVFPPRQPSEAVHHFEPRPCTLQIEFGGYTNPLPREIRNHILGFIGENKFALDWKVTLNLRGCNLGDESAAALAKNSALENVYLSGNMIGDEGASALASSTSIKSLDLEGNEIGDDGAKRLARSNIINYLNLVNNEIGDEGAEALGKCKLLKDLKINGNVIDDNMKVGIRKSFWSRGAFIVI